ncbi:MAG: hypothetical protein COB53_10575 [Elusimicrobia bacterium]|nr:MAG: hypothetical protein COB53_10575 [Elusimicrobiota bacterium]
MTGLGIDAGGTLTKLVAATREGKVLGEAAFPTESGLGPRGFVKNLSAEVRKLERRLGRSVTAAGMAVAGDVDAKAGVIRRWANLESFERFPLRVSVRRALGRPVELHNDANMAAWGAYTVELGRKQSNVAVVTLGTGVGGGAVIDGKLVTGATGSALEFGHTRITSPAGRRCTCGGKGHLEAYAGSYGILGIYRSLSKKKVVSPKDVADAAGRGEAAAKETWRRVGAAMAIGCANLVYILNPDTIVFTGGVSRAGTLFLEPVRRAFKQETFRGPFGHVRLRIARRKGLGALGAAVYALDAVRRA